MILFLVLLIAVDSFLAMSLSSSCPPSTGETEDCLYGHRRNNCNQVVCLKGPGQICGGR